MRFFSARPRVLVFEQGGLHVYYTLCPAVDPTNKPWLVIHHGICHTRRHFPQLIEQLNRLGFNVAMIEQRIRGSCFARNIVTMKRHRQAMARAVDAVEAAIHTPITGYVCHSMGAQFCEEMQQENPRLRRPTVFMAPIPVGGAFWISLRIFLRHPIEYVFAFLRFSVLALVETPERTKEWFFDEQTPDPIYRPASKALRHASFLAYLQLVLRPIIGPRIVDDGNDKQLLMCKTDEIFHPWEFDSTKRRYPNMPVENFAVGGHDFFIQFAEQTADYVQCFFNIPLAKTNKLDKADVDAVRERPVLVEAFANSGHVTVDQLDGQRGGERQPARPTSKEADKSARGSSATPASTKQKDTKLTIEQLKCGNVTYPLRRPCTGVYTTASREFFVIEFEARIVGRGSNAEVAKENWMLNAHEKFQTLIQKRPFEMTEEEQKLWSLFEVNVNVTEYRRRTLVPVRQFGYIYEADICPRSINWEGGDVENIRLDQVISHAFVTFKKGDYLEAITLRDRGTLALSSIVYVEKRSHPKRLPPSQEKAILDSMGSNSKLPETEW